MTEHEREIRAARAKWLRAAILAFAVLLSLLAAMTAESAMTNHIADRIAAGH